MSGAQRSSRLKLHLVETATAAAAAQAMGKIVGAVAAGRLTPSEGAEVAKLVEGYAKVLETSELEARIKVLERRDRP